MSLVQPVVIAKGGTHAQSVRLAARSSVAVLVDRVLQGSELAKSWQPWLDSPRRVQVCSLSPSGLDELHQWAYASNLNPVGLWCGEDTAVALQPMPVEQLPRVLAKAAGKSIELDRDGSRTHHETGPAIDLLGALSTGAAAEAAAGLMWDWVLPKLTDAPEGVAEWSRLGMPLTVDTGLRPKTLTAASSDLSRHGADGNLLAAFRAR